MKFPVTREQLQAYTIKTYREEILEEQTQRKISEYISNLCSEFNRNMERNLSLKQFAWIGLHLIPQAPDDRYLQQFIEKLRELFIDCTINVDAARTYVLIDWS